MFLSDLEAIRHPNAYEFYLIMSTEVDGIKPWQKTEWNTKIAPLLSDLMFASNFKEVGMHVWSEQEDEVVKGHFKQIKHGRLSWKADSFERWTLEKESKTIVNQIDIMLPKASVCEKKEIFPDIYISFQNQNVYSKRPDIPTLQFDVLTIIAIKRSLKVNVKKIMIELSKRLQAKVCIYRDRRWDSSFKKGKWTFYNWIPDTISNGIYEGQCLHKCSFDKIEFEPIFEVIYKPSDE